MSGEFKNATPPHPTIDYAQIKDFDAIYYCGSNCFDVYNLPTKEISESKTLIIANDRSRTIAQATILPEEQKKGTPAKTQIKDIIPYTKDQLISKEYILHSYPHRIFFDVAPTPEEAHSHSGPSQIGTWSCSAVHETIFINKILVPRILAQLH